MTYSLQDAKARFSELVDLSLAEGAQTVTRHGKKVVVVVAYDEYQRLTAPPSSLADFFSSAPRAELDATRVRDQGRAVGFE